MKPCTNRFLLGLGLALCLLASGCAAPAPTPTAVVPTAAAPSAPTNQPNPTIMPTIPPTSAPTVPAPAAAEWLLTSPAFAPEGAIPKDYSCLGADRSPALAWGAPPAGTLSLALVMDDPDAVPVAGYVWDHWVIFNLPPEAQGLPEGLGRGAQLPDGSQQGLNSFRQLGYDGPCPPAGQSHRYVFRLYALDTRLTLGDKTSKADLLQAAEGHILAQTELAGVFPAP
ncbi:YbhB/YbcL family Raf kinase inhibitor-like protein [Levilinea saccharolytica]|nr:YbhB/YbcL family Raf kinase inhibitor-like protein [Levilinea saccharolytica]